VGQTQLPIGRVPELLSRG